MAALTRTHRCPLLGKRRLTRKATRTTQWLAGIALALATASLHAALPPPATLVDLPEAPTNGATPVDPWQQPQRRPETKPKYHWKGLLLQSLEFNVAENGFRLASDDTMRYQIAHQPFWHNYVASVKQFNMGRWNDGDDFIVNYVGHPLQGSVGAFLEIQNSETQSRLQWNDPGYWHSRALAMLWTTAFSTHSEISPFGEAGVGSEGGFTYGTQCMEHCNSTNFKPGDHYTNNTGWVDFIITPTVGMLWVFAEDFLDKDVSPYVFGDNHPVAAKILRGSLNPSRTFANALRGRKPWYRDYEHPMPSAAYGGFGQHLLPSDEYLEFQRNLPRYQISPHLNGLSLATNTLACPSYSGRYCRNLATGAGLEISARLLPWLDVDTDVSYQPNASPEPSDRAGGNALRAVFGLRTGYDTEHYAVHLALRPGIVRWDRAFTTSPTTIVLPNNQLGPDRYDEQGTVTQNPTPQVGPIAHFDWNVNLTGDYKLTPALALRAGIGEDLLRYRTNRVTPPGVGAPPYVSFLSHENFINRGNWSYQVGPVFSF